MFTNSQKKGEFRKVIIDLGAGGIEVGVAVFDDGIAELKVVSGDRWAGGRWLTMKLLEWCEEDLMKRYNLNIRNNPRAFRRVWIQCERAKRTLSSSQQATIEIDSLVNNIDYEVTITQERFAELCSHLLKQIIPTIEWALKDC